MRYRFFSVGAEIHGDPPLDARAFTDVGLVSFGRLSGALLVCGHYRWFVGCSVGDVGRVMFRTRQRVLLRGRALSPLPNASGEHGAQFARLLRASIAHASGADLRARRDGALEGPLASAHTQRRDRCFPRVSKVAHHESVLDTSDQ